MEQDQNQELNEQPAFPLPAKKSRPIFRIVAVCFLIFIAAEVAGVYVGVSHRKGVSSEKDVPPAAVQDAAGMKTANARLDEKIRKLAPADTYIIIDTGRNRLFLRKKDKLILEAVISSGSGNVLDDPTGGRQWVFDTPRGAFTVQSKHKSPVWRKPDWAFIEEGKAIPKNAQERLEEGMLGDYALGFGNGYFIHGTLYKRLLGRNVTHGCVRVGDKDLEAVFQTAKIGDRIFIF